jgi:hypothetical protein
VPTSFVVMLAVLFVVVSFCRRSTSLRPPRPHISASSKTAERFATLNTLVTQGVWGGVLPLGILLCLFVIHLFVPIWKYKARNYLSEACKKPERYVGIDTSIEQEDIIYIIESLTINISSSLLILMPQLILNAVSNATHIFACLKREILQHFRHRKGTMSILNLTLAPN